MGEGTVAAQKVIDHATSLAGRSENTSLSVMSLVNAVREQEGALTSASVQIEQLAQDCEGLNRSASAVSEAVIAIAGAADTACTEADRLR